ncbi:predicted protein [Nematostella vectensis]|uniref:Uncharacterized protein n=1 Tax=Nematostella vectensis TaxID=45351 RepID=A7T000_NEMVE|nr:predicted protein [Nematostella vectensis]|eukprot:XP_001622823.1 predicted protein [Nematostella vectensis]
MAARNPESPQSTPRRIETIETPRTPHQQALDVSPEVLRSLISSFDHLRNSVEYKHLQQQNSLAALETTVEESGDLLGLRAGMKPPTFSGDGIEDLDESVFPNSDSPDTRDQTVESFEINNNDFSSQENAQSNPNLDNNDRFRPVRRTFFSDEAIQVNEGPPRKCFPPTEVMFNFEEGPTPQVLAEGHSICDETFNDNHQSILDMDFEMDNSILQQPMSPSPDETDDNLPEINTIINTSNSHFGNQNNGTDVTVNVSFLTTDNLMLHGQISGHDIDLLVDTGAAISCISSSTWRRLNTTNNLQLRDFSLAALQTVDGHSLTILDIFTADLSLGNRVFTLDLLVIKNLTMLFWERFLNAAQRADRLSVTLL